MTEIVRPRRIPRAAIVATATTLMLCGSTSGNLAFSPSETHHRGDDAIIKQFREIAKKALNLFDRPPAGASRMQNDALLDLPYTAIFDPQHGWELHIASYSKYDTANPIPDNLRQVALFTGKDLPSVNGKGTDASISASINSTSDAIGTSVEVTGKPLDNGDVPWVTATANSQNDLPATKELTDPKGKVLCQETYATNPKQQIYDALNSALDAIQHGITPTIALPQVTSIGTNNANGFCPQ